MLLASEAKVCVLSLSAEEDGAPASGGEGEGSEDDEDGISPPAAGNTDGDTLPMSKTEAREARGEFGMLGRSLDKV